MRRASSPPSPSTTSRTSRGVADDREDDVGALGDRRRRVAPGRPGATSGIGTGTGPREHVGPRSPASSRWRAIELPMTPVPIQPILMGALCRVRRRDGDVDRRVAVFRRVAHLRLTARPRATVSAARRRRAGPGRRGCCALPVLAHQPGLQAQHVHGDREAAAGCDAEEGAVVGAADPGLDPHVVVLGERAQHGPRDVGNDADRRASTSLQSLGPEASSSMSAPSWLT